MKHNLNMKIPNFIIDGEIVFVNSTDRMLSFQEIERKFLTNDM